MQSNRPDLNRVIGPVSGYSRKHSRRQQTFTGRMQSHKTVGGSAAHSLKTSGIHRVPNMKHTPSKQELGQVDVTGAPRPLKCLSYRTLKELENDRRRIALELHDSIAASLSAIKNMMEKNQVDLETENPGTSISLKPAIGYLGDVIKSAKRISTGLRPATLDELGLQATLSSFCRKFSSQRKGLRVDYRIDIEEERIPEDQKIFIYRIVKEAMMMAAGHGHPMTIRTSVVTNDHLLRLTVYDDGPGIDRKKFLKANQNEPDSGNDLQDMRERVAVCGGTLEIERQSDAGTEIRVSLPLHDSGRSPRPIK